MLKVILATICLILGGSLALTTEVKDVQVMAGLGFIFISIILIVWEMILVDKKFEA